MRSTKGSNYLTLADEKGELDSFISHLNRVVPDRYGDSNLVIDLLGFTSLDLEDLLKFLKLSTYHRSSGHSFVLVTTTVDVDDIPMELVVVPTMQEAEDIIQMEEIERDLGF